MELCTELIYAMLFADLLSLHLFIFFYLVHTVTQVGMSDLLLSKHKLPNRRYMNMVA